MFSACFLISLESNALPVHLLRQVDVMCNGSDGSSGACDGNGDCGVNGPYGADGLKGP